MVMCMSKMSQSDTKFRHRDNIKFSCLRFRIHDDKFFFQFYLWVTRNNHAYYLANRNASYLDMGGLISSSNVCFRCHFPSNIFHRSLTVAIDYLCLYVFLYSSPKYLSEWLTGRGAYVHSTYDPLLRSNRSVSRVIVIVWVWLLKSDKEP